MKFLDTLRNYDYADLMLRAVKAVLYFIFISIIWKIITTIFWMIAVQIYMVRWHLLILFVLSAYYLHYSGWYYL